MKARLRRAAWAAVAPGGVLLAFAPAVAGLCTLSQRDTDQLYAPIRTLVVDALRHGRLPLWNPYEGTGKPLFAEGIHSVLHPVSLLAAAVAPSSIDFLILAYLVAAALGAFLLARALGASPPASAGAGLAFALSGFSVSMTGNLVFLAGLSTLPWLLAAARHAGAGSPWGMVATALAAACAFLSGDVQVALVGLALGLALAADAGGLRGAARAAAAMVPGLLLAAVQIVPTWRLLPDTVRDAPLEDWEKTQWSLAPWRLLELVLPGLFRGPLEEIPRTTSGASLGFTFAESVYLGAPLLVAAGLGAFSRDAHGRRRTGLLLGAAALVLLWLSLGQHLGARQLLDGVPVWSRFRYSEKLLAPLGLCVAALGALGVDAFGAGALPRGARWALTGCALAAAGLLTALAAAPGPTLTLAGALLGDAGSYFRARLAAGLPHLVVALAVLVALDRILGGRWRPLGLALLLALAPTAAVRYGAHFGSPELRRLPALHLESSSPAPRVAQPVPLVEQPEQTGDPIEHRARLASALLYPAVNAAHRVDTIEPYGAFEARRLTALASAFTSTWARYFRRLGLTHVAVPRPVPDVFRARTALATEGGERLQRDEPGGVEVWAVPHRPWAFFAPGAVAVGGPEDSLAAAVELFQGEVEGLVVVEAPSDPATAPGRILAVERGTETIRIDAAADAPALLVVQDAFWRGWRASLDDRPTEILAADHVVRAIRWPAGRHRLEMVYDPPELRAGLALSALGAAFLLGLVALALRRTGQRNWWLGRGAPSRWEGR